MWWWTGNVTRGDVVIVVFTLLLSRSLEGAAMPEWLIVLVVFLACFTLVLLVNVGDWAVKRLRQVGLTRLLPIAAVLLLGAAGHAWAQMYHSGTSWVCLGQCGVTDAGTPPQTGNSMTIPSGFSAEGWPRYSVTGRVTGSPCAPGDAMTEEGCVSPRYDDAWRSDASRRAP